MKRIASFVSLFVIALTVAAGTAIALAQPSTPTPKVAGYTLPADLDGGHFHLAPLPQNAIQDMSVTSDSAVSLAEGYAAGLAPNPTGVSVQAVVFTDRHRGIENADGSLTLSFVNIPAYVIRFTGVPQPVFGAIGSGQRPPAAQELNVVIDARTGDCVEMFSFE